MVPAVLAVGLFVAFWVVIGLALFFVAIRGGIGGARATLQTQSRRGRRWMDGLFVIAFVGFGIALPAIFLFGNHYNASGQVGGIRLTAAEKTGRQLFAQKCAFCHTLAAANSVGKVGPNLDMLQPPYTLILSTIAHGCVQNPPPNSPQTCLGYGNMPAAIVGQPQAQQVASFIARVAGKE
jgi:mono/diheme cytochrome c family protein